MHYKIGQLAKLAGCQVVTIRYYEKQGLMSAPERTGGNYRLYDDEDLQRLLFIRHCRRHGMKLAEIRELLAFRDNPQADCDWINTMLESHMENIGQQIKSLTQLKNQLSQLRQQCSGGRHGNCGILQSLSNTAHCPYCEDFRCQPAGHSVNG